MKRFIIRLALILAAVVCWLSAAGLVVHNLQEDRAAAESALLQLAALTSELPERKTADDAFLRNLSNEVPTLKTKTKDGLRYVGVLEIPALKLSLPVLEEWSYENLKKAPCRYVGSPFTNDFVICAHNYRSHFNALRWVKMGEDVYFTTVDGIVFHYVIVNRETLQPDENDRLIESDGSWDLTLFTCYIGGATRCVIRCESLEESAG